MAQFYTKIVFIGFLAFLGMGLSFGQVIITEIADPNNAAGARYVELYNLGSNSVNLNTWALRRWTNDNASPQSDEALSGTIVANGFIVFATNSSTFNSTFPSFSGTIVDMNGGGPTDSNGDDKIALIDGTGTLVDIFGTPGSDSNNANNAENFEDGRAERVATVTAPNSTWTVSEWNVDNDQGFGSGAQNAPAGFDPGEWIGVSTGPSITSNPNSISGLGYVFGDSTSIVESINIEGSNLDDTDVTIALPISSDFEIAENTGGIFSNSITLTAYDGSATNIFTRLKTGLNEGAYTDDIEISGGGLTSSLTVALSGEVTAAPPVNDDCGNAIALVNNAPAISGTLEASTVASPFTTGIDVWYSFTPSYNETYTITLSNFLGDADLYLFDQGNSCPTTTTDIASAITADSPEIISQNLIPGTTYYIAVVPFDVAAESTSFDIQVTAPPETTKVNFANASATVNEGDATVDVDLTIVNEDATNATNVEVALTTGDAADIDSYTTQTLSFPAGSSANQTVTINLTDDALDEADETLTFTLQNVSGGNNAQIGSQATFDLTIQDNDLPAPIILPYNEDFSDCLTAEWITFDEAGNINSWECGSNEYAMNGFNGGTGDDIDWLISGFRINFDDYSTVNIDVLTAEQFGGTVNESGEFRLVYSSDYDGLGNPTGFTWTDLTFDPNNTSTGFGLSTPSTTSVDASSVTGIAYIAFIYDETVTGADTEDWRIQNVEITGTSVSANDDDSDVVFTSFDPTDNIDYITYQASSGLTTGNAIKVAEFEIRDGGATTDADVVGTILTGLSLDITNFENLAAIALFDGSTNVSEVTTVSATTNFVSINSGSGLTAADDGSKIFDVYVTFSNATVIDNEQLEFSISSVTADGVNGSVFSAPDGSGASTPTTLDDNRIEVTATDLIFDQNPTDVGVSNAMTPSPTVVAVDINANTDLDYTASVSLSVSSANFDAAATTSVNAVSGLATFDNLIFNSNSTGSTLTASSGALNDDTSVGFDVFTAPITIAIEDFDGTTPSWQNDISDQTFVDPSSPSEGLFIQPSTNIGSGNTAYGDDLGGESGEPTLSPYTFTFEEVNVENFSNLELSFDYYAFANADTGSYEIFIDGLGLGPVEFYNDPDTTPVQGTISESIGTATTISLVLTGTLNGGGDIIELDNFKIEGDYDGDLVYSGGSWSPNAPSLSTGMNDALVQDGTYTTGGDIELNSISVLSDASVNISPDDVLTLKGDIYNNGTFTFKSDASNSAQLAGATGVTITGNVTVERFIPARRAYRLLTSAVTTTTSINANWQEGATSSTDNPEPGFGIHITGGDEAIGFDVNGTGNASMFTFDVTNASNDSGAWTALDDTNGTNGTNLNAGEGYLTFVRGDRSVDVTDNSTTATNTTLRATGNLHTGEREFSSDTPALYGLSAVEDFFSLVGNPYQAIVNINNLVLTNINPNHYWVWDPNLGERGGYTTVSLPGGTNSNGSPADEFIQPGQSFFVQTVANGAASVTFNENDKTVTGNATAVFIQDTPLSIKLLLYKTSAYNAGEREADGTLINFSDNGNNELDQFDADKLQGPDESLARLHSNELVSIEYRALPAEDEILQLSTMGYTADDYTFVVNSSQIQDNFDAYLLDQYTGIQTPLNEGATAVSFSVDPNIPESIAEDRFSLVFDNTTLGIDENTFGSDFRVFPNPSTNGQFIISTPGLNGEVTVEMANLLGRKIYTQQLNIENQQVNVNAGNLSTGVYVVKLTKGNQSFNSKLIVKY